MDDHGQGGWALTFTCSECGTEDTFRGVVPSLVGDAAARAGWHFDRVREYGTTPSRCPEH